jgi:hypothetical protein
VVWYAAVAEPKMKPFGNSGYFMQSPFSL